MKIKELVKYLFFNYIETIS